MAISRSVKDGRKPRNVKRETPRMDELDLGTINLKALADNLRANIRAGIPSSKITLWGGRRQLQKLEMDLQQQSMLLQQIENLGMSMDVLAQTEAKRLLVPEMIEGIINGHRQQVELATIQFKAQIKQIEDDADRRRAETREIDARAKDTEADAQVKIIIATAEAQALLIRTNSEANDIDTKAAERKAKIKIIETIVEQGIDLENANIITASIINTILGGSGDIDLKSALEEELKEYRKRQEEAKTRTEEEKAKQEKENTKRKQHETEFDIGSEKKARGGFGDD